jgi:hypothetical protein
MAEEPHIMFARKFEENSSVLNRIDEMIKEGL